MIITVYECPMGHVRNAGPVTEEMMPLHCIECESELVPVQYVPAPMEFMTPFEERVEVILPSRQIVFYDRYWEGHRQDPGIIWMLGRQGWDAFFNDEEARLLCRTKSILFPNPDDIQTARDVYQNLCLTV